MTNLTKVIPKAKIGAKEVAMAGPINLYDAKTHLSELVERAAAGEEILIAKNGRPMARLVPLAPTVGRRKPAGSLGISYIAPDFDAPLPADIQIAFDGEP